MNDSNYTIFLIGFMGCGKSTVSKELSRQFGLKIIEMDQLIAERERMSIPDIFSKKGEPYFRALETSLLKDLKTQTNLVVSCGGGVAMRRENVALMKEQGRIVLLTAKPKTILERVSHSDDRPLLKGRKTISEITGLLSARRPAYEAAADFCVTTDHKDASDIAVEIMGKLTCN